MLPPAIGWSIGRSIERAIGRAIERSAPTGRPDRPVYLGERVALDYGRRGVGDSEERS